MVKLPPKGFSSNPWLYRHPNMGLPPPVPSYQNSLLASLWAFHSYLVQVQHSSGKGGMPVPPVATLRRRSRLLQSAVILCRRSPFTPLNWIPDRVFISATRTHLFLSMLRFISGFLILSSIVFTVRTTRFSFREFYILPAQCIYVFCMDLRTNSDYFPVQY